MKNSLFLFILFFALLTTPIKSNDDDEFQKPVSKRKPLHIGTVTLSAPSASISSSSSTSSKLSALSASMESKIPPKSPLLARIDTRGSVSSKKVQLPPSRGLMDWVGYSKTVKPTAPRPVTKKELATHNTKESCWMAISGKVYDCTQYLEYHPGGTAIMMKAAGKDGTQLFRGAHPWVSADGFLANFYVGELVP